MRIHSIIPTNTIANYVSKVFVIEECKLSMDIKFPFVANGYPGIIFQTTNGSTISSSNRVSCLFLFGQTIRPIELYTEGSLTLIAYFFYPHVLKTLFGISAKELTDISIDLDQLQQSKNLRLKEQLIHTTSLSSRLDLLNNFILKLVEKTHSNVCHDILFATNAIRKSKGLISLTMIRDDLRISERTFRRLFDLHVGTSPQMFRRICQFDAAFQQLNSNQFSKLSDVAYENGYSDQSHLVRTFKEFTTFSPSAYLRKSSAFLRLNQ